MAGMSEPTVSLVESAKARLQAEIDAQLGALAAQHQEAIESARQSVEREADERWSTRLKAVEQKAVEANGTSDLLKALRGIDNATSVSDTLHAILRAAAGAAPRVSLLVSQAEPVAGSSETPMSPWTTDGVAAVAPEPGRASMRTFPLLLDGVSVAVLHGDGEAGNGDAPTPGTAWIDRLEVIAAVGATRLGYLTALRTVQAMRWRTAEPAVARSLSATTPPAQSSDEEEQAAKRYARLLVSEIKLYNEAAVRTGREQRDLLKRLQPEIDRARRLYEQRIPAALRARTQLFDHELVQTLAGGEPSLLG
jgi:hypothetical protein